LSATETACSEHRKGVYGSVHKKRICLIVYIQTGKLLTSLPNNPIRDSMWVEIDAQKM
jgi:hypothetical protein